MAVDSPRASRRRGKGDKTLVKGCEKAGCPVEVPHCFARASEKCVFNGTTSRWYHISMGEHFCNECFEHFYRSNKPGHPLYLQWKGSWMNNAISPPSIKAFMADQMLPFWIQCTKTGCGKWRQIPKEFNITTDFIKSYKCGAHISASTKKFINHCDFSEDIRIVECKSKDWWSMVNTLSLLRDCPSAPYLTDYFPDGIGLSPTSANTQLGTQKPIEFENPNFRPFYSPNQTARALCIRPDILEYEEARVFPSFVKTAALYLALRNLLIQQWYAKVESFLPWQYLASLIICRGLIRCFYIQTLPSVWEFLNRKGMINYGLVSRISDLKPRAIDDESMMDIENNVRSKNSGLSFDGQLLPSLFQQNPEIKNKHIIVIGAGMAGISAAKQLHNFGFKVTVLEANDRIGGRILDDDTILINNKVVSKGAMILTGLTNNPLSAIASQYNALYDTNKCMFTKMADACELITSCDPNSTDKNVQAEFVRKDDKDMVEQHFNSVLLRIADWRKGLKQKDDVSLLNKIRQVHNEMLQAKNEPFTQLQQNIFEFHISNLEYACGTDLSQVSALQWDQNESFTQFDGDHATLNIGFGALLAEMAQDLEIKLDNKVKSIKYNGEQITISSHQGTQYKGDKVVLALPISTLNKRLIDFEPPLPHAKLEAIDQLGNGVIEKIALNFPTNFWGDKIKNPCFFGYISPNSINDEENHSTHNRNTTAPSERGLFYVFYDMSSTFTNNDNDRNTESNPNVNNVLVAFISGPAVSLINQPFDNDMNDENSVFDKDEVNLERCMNQLKLMFPDKEIPKPTSYFITHWANEPNIGMAYSYVRVGGTGQAYDILAEPVKKRLYFCGECTNRHFPMTVTGAYLSGIMQAGNIVSEFYH